MFYITISLQWIGTIFKWPFPTDSLRSTVLERVLGTRFRGFRAKRSPRGCRWGVRRLTEGFSSPEKQGDVVEDLNVRVPELQ